jgi:hypothetical protein
LSLKFLLAIRTGYPVAFPGVGEAMTCSKVD